MKNKIGLVEMNLSQLQAEFINSSNEWEGLISETNKNRRKMDKVEDYNISVMKELKSRGDEGVVALSVLLHNESNYVRMNAANFLLGIYTNAVSTIEHIAQG